MILETKRLLLRKLTQADFPGLCKILQDPDVMYAYEHAFSDAEVHDWLGRQLARYTTDGFGLWAVLLKETGKLIGQCGITMQDFDGRRVPEIGYLFLKAYWHYGYAAEAAAGCKQYAFDVLHLPMVYSIIRDTNTASQNVAKRIDMTVCGQLVKHYYGVTMPHLVFSVHNPAAQPG